MPTRENLLRKASGLRRRVVLAWDTFTMRRPLDSTGADEFLEEAYMQLLGRPPEPAGKLHYIRKIEQGTSRIEVMIDLARSDEYKRRAAAQLNSLPDITHLRPDRYAIEDDNLDWRSFHTFEVRDPSDYDWLADQISGNGYYERPGVWSMDINLDKRVMAEMIALMGPKTTLEVGCANGAMMQCLEELGVTPFGVDISTTSRNSAPEHIRRNIHLADLGETQLDLEVDLLYGLDIFEHINPNSLDTFLKGCFSHIKTGGLFFTNTPAFGEDEVFGKAFHPFLPSWEPELESGLFSHIVTDEQGFPENGHLIWATAKWWDTKFQSFGLTREVEVERALHILYDDYINATSTARRSIFIYSDGNLANEQRTAIIDRITAYNSPSLREYEESLGATS